MKKMALIGFVLMVSCFSQSLVFGREFTYENVIGCGPQRDLPLSSLPHIDMYKYFYVHTSLNGDFIVWNDSYEYPSFTQQSYHQLYVQNGKTTSSSLAKEGPILKYQLISKFGSETKHRLLMIDTSTMTYISKVGNHQPMMGVCWIEDLK